MQNESEYKLGGMTRVVGPALAAIPYVGDVLAAAWSEWDTTRRFCRLQETMEHIQRKLSKLPPKDDAADDAGMHFLELVLREAQLQHSEAKRERLANLLVSAWVSNTPPQYAFDESLLFLRATTVFGDTHIAILNKLHEVGVGGSVPFGDLAQLVSDVSETDRNEAALIVLNHLCSEFAFAKRAWDLNRPDIGGKPLSSGNLSPEGIARKCFHSITPRGIRYVDFVLRGPKVAVGV